MPREAELMRGCPTCRECRGLGVLVDPETLWPRAVPCGCTRAPAGRPLTIDCPRCGGTAFARPTPAGPHDLAFECPACLDSDASIHAESADASDGGSETRLHR